MSKPFNAYTVKEIGEGKEKKSFWTKLGVAFPHKDGEGFDVILEALPVSGRLVIRAPKEGEEKETA